MSPGHDRRILYATAFLRSLGTGLVGVLLGLYLTRLRFSASAVGMIVGAGLGGGALAALLATLRADAHGRRRFLVELAALGVLGTALLLAASSPLVVGIAAFVGMLNGMGRDRGAALIIEQAILPATTTDAERTRVLAWYNVLQDAGHALGALLAGLPSAITSRHAASGDAPFRLAFVFYSLLLVATVILYRRLSAGTEAASARPGLRLSPESRKVVVRISALFGLDGLGGGFLTSALLTYFFFERFGVGGGTIGTLFFGARVLNAVSHLGAAWLARRIGLVNTMVFTHIPSSVLLATVAFAPNFLVAAILFLLREGLVEMDVPTRQSYVLAVVRPEERTAANGITSLVRLAAWAVAPLLAGVIMQEGSLGLPLVVGAAMKITYDVLLYFSFRSVRPPEEVA
jgi:MFS family permease